MSQEKKGDPQPGHGRDNEQPQAHGGGRPVKPTTSAPKPQSGLTELNFEFWHNITKR